MIVSGSFEFAGMKNWSSNPQQKPKMVFECYIKCIFFWFSMQITVHSTWHTFFMYGSLGNCFSVLICGLWSYCNMSLSRFLSFLFFCLVFPPLPRKKIVNTIKQMLPSFLLVFRKVRLSMVDANFMMVVGLLVLKGVTMSYTSLLIFGYCRFTMPASLVLTFRRNDVMRLIPSQDMKMMSIVWNSSFFGSSLHKCSYENQVIPFHCLSLI